MQQPLRYAEDIREELVEWLRARESSEPLVLREVPLLDRKTIADVLVIGDELFAFEIKSDRDNLSRLVRQVAGYSRVAHYTSVVLDGKSVPSGLPAECGVLRLSGKLDAELEVVRKPVRRDVEARDLVALLTRFELQKILRAVGATRYSLFGKAQLVNRTVDALGSEASEIAIKTLRTRKTWTAEQLGVTEAERLQRARTTVASWATLGLQLPLVS